MGATLAKLATPNDLLAALTTSTVAQPVGQAIAAYNALQVCANRADTLQAIIDCYAHLVRGLQAAGYTMAAAGLTPPPTAP